MGEDKKPKTITAGDGALLHGFEQRLLRFGRSAVDFVGQDQVGEDGAGLEAQRFGAAIAGFDHHAAHDIGRHEVRRELDSGIFQLQSPRQSAEQRGFAQPGNAFQKHMPGGQQANQDAFHDIVLPHDDFGDLPANRIEALDGELECRFGSHVLIVEHDGRHIPMAHGREHAQRGERSEVGVGRAYASF